MRTIELVITLCIEVFRWLQMLQLEKLMQL